MSVPDISYSSICLLRRFVTRMLCLLVTAILLGHTVPLPMMCIKRPTNSVKFTTTNVLQMTYNIINYKLTIKLSNESK